MNNEQLMTLMRSTLITAGVSWLTKSGIAASTATELVTTAVAFLMAAGAAGWGFYAKRNAGLAMAAASVPGTVVITAPEIASATPAHNNIISNQTNTVTAK